MALVVGVVLVVNVVVIVLAVLLALGCTLHEFYVERRGTRR